VAEAFVEFLHTDEVKEIFADAGFRSTDIEEARKGGNGFPPIEDLWDIDDIGGWGGVNEKLFGDAGIVTQAQAGSA
jgi:sulfate transport system substrate-binding protein